MVRFAGGTHYLPVSPLHERLGPGWPIPNDAWLQWQLAEGCVTDDECWFNHAPWFLGELRLSSAKSQGQNKRKPLHELGQCDLYVHVLGLLLLGLSNCFMAPPDSSSNLSNIGTRQQPPMTANKQIGAVYYYCPYGPEFTLACSTSATQSV